MSDTYTPNLGLTKPCTRKNWAEAVNENFEKLGVLHYIHIDGSLHICKNSIYQDGSWIQPDTSLRSSLIVMGSQGDFVLYTCPAGNPTISAWTPVATFGSDGSLALSSGSTIGSDGSLSLPGGICISNGSLTLPFGISANDGYLTLPGGISANNGSLILPNGASIGGAVRCPTLATEEIYGLLGTVASASSNVRAEASYTETYELGTSITIPNHYTEGQTFTILATLVTSGFGTNHYNSLHFRRIRSGIITDFTIITYSTLFSGVYAWTPTAGTIQGGDIICLYGEYNTLHNEFVKHSKIQVCCDDRVLTSTLHGDWADFT